MMPFSKLESRFGLTRGDVTVALFLAGTALAGFVYTTFFDSRPPSAERRELMGLRLRHDSVVEAYRKARIAELDPAQGLAGRGQDVADAADSDNIAPWLPSTAAEAEMEEAVERVLRPAAGAGGKTMPSSPININTAAKSALMQLPGVGEKTADAIIERRTHVPFRRVEDIMDVKGIGEKKFEKMKQHIVVK